jgi:double-stranded uracil-DNA glycosylase
MPSHRVREVWMGSEVETLEDLLRPRLRAVCVGINPSPVSVAAGHYYQGRAGQRFFERLRSVNLLPSGDHSYEDDQAFALGVGFTDIIKRPTARAKDLRSAEYKYGRERLRAVLEENNPSLVIFTFKKTAEVVFGEFPGNGFMRGQQLGRSDVSVMPGPYERIDKALATLAMLRGYLGEDTTRRP